MCGSSLGSYKTKSKTVADPELGRIKVRETLRVCSEHKYMEEDGNRKVMSFGSIELARLVASGSSHSYRLVVDIGERRFQQHRQIGEIKEEILHEYGLDIPSRQISYLAERFLLYVRCVHQESTNLLRQQMETRGGWVLHIDASAEGKELVFVGMGAFQGEKIVLFSERVATERADRLYKVLQNAKVTLDEPLAIVRDMGRGGWDASTEVFPGVPQRACQQHFLSDVGGDILKKLHDTLRGLFRRVNIRKSFKDLQNDLSRQLGLSTVPAPNYEIFLKEKVRTSRELLWALTTWVLDYRSDGEGLGFPFDLPYWFLYQRMAQAKKALNNIVKGTCDLKAKRQAKRFQNRLDKVFGKDDTGKAFQEVISKMEKPIGLFERLRKILRLQAKPNDQPNRALTVREEARLSKQELKEFLEEAKTGARNEHYDKELRQAYKIIRDHINKHGEYLFLPELDKNRKPFPEWAILERTNNIEESFFGQFKTGIRRATGKKNLSQVFAAQGADRALVENLKSPTYVRVVYGSLDKLPERFAKVPVEKVRELAKNKKKHTQDLERLPKYNHIRIEDLLYSIDRTMSTSKARSIGANEIARKVQGTRPKCHVAIAVI